MFTWLLILYLVLQFALLFVLCRIRFLSRSDKTEREWLQSFADVVRL